MIRSMYRLGVPFVGTALVSLAVAACSSDDSGKKGDSVADAGAGGAATGSGGASSGGSATSGGASTATGGASAAGDASTGEEYTCFARQAAAQPPVPGTGTAGSDCCQGLGTCMAKSDLTGDPAAASYGGDACNASADLLCAPKPPAELPDGGLLPACQATYGTLTLEGRCLPKCFTAGNPLTEQLSIGDCPTDTGFEDVICAPCFNPVDGTSTGACNRALPDGGTDAPVETAKQFAECGTYKEMPLVGLCVPSALVAAVVDVALVPKDSCGTGELCAPKNKVEDQSICFAKCESPGFGAGACTPAYIVEVVFAGIADALITDECPAGEVCAPCINPVDGNPTQACNN